MSLHRSDFVTPDSDLVLLSVLADGAIHSGKAVAKAMGVGIADIRRAIGRLRSAGAVIEAIPGMGYRMPAFVPLDREAILSALPPPRQVWAGTIHVLSGVSSTNTSLMAMARIGEAKSGTVLVAEWQTQGRGRNGHAWLSPCGATLPLSCYWRFKRMPVEVGTLGLGVGVAVHDALVSLGFEGIGLKWPNDIFAGDAKLGGILIEAAGQARGDYRVVIGVGLNVDFSRHDLASIQRQVADLKSLTTTAGPIDRNLLAAAIILRLKALLDSFETGFVLDRWRRLDILHGRRISLLLGRERVEGLAAGVDDLGRLLVRDGNGRLRAVAAGDVSLGSLS